MNIKKKHACTHGLRTIFVKKFFWIIALFAAGVFAVIYTAEQYNMPKYLVKNPGFILLVILILCIVLSSSVYYFILRKIFSPLKKLSDASKQIAKGNYNVQIDYNGDIEELQSSINNFNRMVKELSSVELIRNDFVANVSHEFKTPLASIMGYVTLMQDPELTESDKKEYISKIFFNIDKLNDLTENILRLSKLDNQNYPTEVVTYRLDEQIREAIVLLEPKWSKKNINFDINMPEINYSGQKELLFQVWTNIISNAIKFSDHNGSIMVFIRQSKGYTEVVVCDDGIGMDEETQSHIFDKFYQGDTSRRSQGNGLGLALCKKILDRCGGKIFVTSEPGNGSVFIVQLETE